MSPGLYGTEEYIDDVCHGSAETDSPDRMNSDAPLSDSCLREHSSQLRDFVLLMTRRCLTIEPGKFFLFATRLKFCGHVLIGGRRASDLEKTAAVMRWDWPPIKTPRHMKAFPGVERVQR